MHPNGHHTLGHTSTKAKKTKKQKKKKKKKKRVPRGNIVILKLQVVGHQHGTVLGWWGRGLK